MTAAKAVVAAIGTIVTALTAALADEVLDLTEVAHLVTVAVECAATVFAVYQVRNVPSNPVVKDEPPTTFVSKDTGYGAVELVVGVLLVLILVVVLLRLL